MFISQLKNKLRTYDQYGIHRINGLKILYLLELLFLFNFIYTVPNPYFYFFYVPLTAFAAEVLGTTLQEKSLFLFFTLLGCSISVFLFGLLSEYYTFFFLFAFFYSLALYYIVIHKLKRMLPLVPLILSLAVYSLIYKNADTNFYIALNHALQTIVALILMLIGLYFFPKKYYLSIWYRAFCEVITKLEQLTRQICENNVTQVPIFSGIIIMERYSKMLSKRMKCHSILKITLLAFELIMTLSYFVTFKHNIKMQYKKILNHYLIQLLEACKQKKPVVIPQGHFQLLEQTHGLRLIYQIIMSWNYLCADL